ncbi:hypothetical protein NDU88_004136 [Pleurodeles waltl]|uniref:Uncharacterized protein n=1 Tax=Pleurodeles waltl TaxID=8319 RepID=A0AAV7W5R4_PLEWA|nr:hypothetical protein NDU88_004136 [Pleurodeles waltl]
MAKSLPPCSPPRGHNCGHSLQYGASQVLPRHAAHAQARPRKTTADRLSRRLARPCEPQYTAGPCTWGPKGGPATPHRRLRLSPGSPPPAPGTRMAAPASGGQNSRARRRSRSPGPYLLCLLPPAAQSATPADPAGPLGMPPTAGPLNAAGTTELHARRQRAQPRRARCCSPHAPSVARPTSLSGSRTFSPLPSAQGDPD